MKIIKSTFLIVSILIFTIGCSKSKSDDEINCEKNQTSKITFKNISDASLRIEMSKQFDSNYNPVDPVFTFDLEPGKTSDREFKSGRYFIQWKANCNTKCTQKTFYAKEFETCKEYEESH